MNVMENLKNILPHVPDQFLNQIYTRQILQNIFTNIPYEILNKIYCYRATIILKNIITSYHLDFDKVCQFLRKYKGIIAGSCALCCFDTEINFNDIDIFIEFADDADYRQTYKEFLEIFTIDQKEVTVNKFPVCNSFERNFGYSFEHGNKYLPFYKYCFAYLEKKIDMTLLYLDPKKIFSEEKYLQCCEFIFDGSTWSVPFVSIHSCVYTHEYTILDPYNSYFLDVYDPWGSYRDDCEINEWEKLNPIVISTDYKMEKIYDFLINFYNCSSDMQIYKMTELSDLLEFDHHNDIMQTDTIDNIASISEEFRPSFDIRTDTIDNIASMLKGFKLKGFKPSFCDVRDIEKIDAEHKSVEIIDAEHKSVEIIDVEHKSVEIIDVEHKSVEIIDVEHKSVEIPNKMNRKTIKNLYRIYRAWHRILKYISKGYIFTNIENFLSKKIIDAL